MNAYQKRKAERAAKQKARYEAKKEQKILADVTSAVSEFELYQIRRHFMEFENGNSIACGCKGEYHE